MRDELKCVGYARVSTDKQAEKEAGSLQTQEDRIRKFVETKSTTSRPHSLLRIYREEGRSAKDVNRPELQRLLYDLASGEFNALVVTKLDRLTRSIQDFYKMWDVLKRHNVELISLDDSFDTSTPIGRAMLNIILTFAQLERETTSERTRGKMQWRAEQGLWSGAPPVGFDLDQQEKGRLVENEEESKLVRLIFDKYWKLQSIGEVVKELCRDGIRMPISKSRSGRESGGTLLYKTTVQRILTGVVYTGKIPFKGNVYAGKHPAIIDQAAFDRVQDVLRRNGIRRRPIRPLSEHCYILRGLLFCGRCGSSMTPKASGSWSHLNFYYVCTRGLHTKGEACLLKYVPASAVEEAVVSKLKSLALSRENIEEVIARAARKNSEELSRIADERRSVESRLAQAKGQVSQLLAVVKAEGAAAFRSIREELERLEKDREAMEGKIQELKDQERRVRAENLNSELVCSSLDELGKIIEVAKPEELQRVLPMFLERVVFDYPDDKGVGYMGLRIFEQAAAAVGVDQALESNVRGARRDLNPQQPEPQSGALTRLSYGHRR
jgi:site-specific DNA recombinase